MLSKIWNYLFPPNDWEIKEVMQGDWEYGDNKQKTGETSVYEFYYSSYRKVYNLELSGYKPKQHHKYPEVIKRLIELENESKTPKENP